MNFFSFICLTSVLFFVYPSVLYADKTGDPNASVVRVSSKELEKQEKKKRKFSSGFPKLLRKRPSFFSFKKGDKKLNPDQYPFWILTFKLSHWRPTKMAHRSCFYH